MIGEWRPCSGCTGVPVFIIRFVTGNRGTDGTESKKGRAVLLAPPQSVLVDRVSETITGVTMFFVASCGYPQRVAPQRCPLQFYRSCLVVFDIPFLPPGMANVPAPSNILSAFLANDDRNTIGNDDEFRVWMGCLFCHFNGLGKGGSCIKV